MYFSCHSHTLIISVALQGCVNLGIAETPVHFRTIKMVAVLGEYNALHLVRLSFALERNLHALPFQVGDKHVPVAAPADLPFENVVKLVFGLVRLF